MEGAGCVYLMSARSYYERPPQVHPSNSIRMGLAGAVICGTTPDFALDRCWVRHIPGNLANIVRSKGSLAAR